jgi:uncharacterized protein (DUF1697 family)
MTAKKMTRWVALLRAVNLGSYNKVAMADLRALLESLGYDDVRTHLQSGNVVFTTGSVKAPTLERTLRSSIAEAFGVDTPVLVRTGVEMAAIVKGNPFMKRGAETKPLHVAFLSDDPASAKVKDLDPERYAPDEFAFGDRAVYLRLTNGMQGSKLPNWDKVLGVTATVRNWNTVTRLHELATE